MESCLCVVESAERMLVDSEGRSEGTFSDFPSYPSSSCELTFSDSHCNPEFLEYCEWMFFDECLKMLIKELNQDENSRVGRIIYQKSPNCIISVSHQVLCG